MPMHRAKSAFNYTHNDVRTEREREILNSRSLNQVGREKNYYKSYWYDKNKLQNLPSN